MNKIVSIIKGLFHATFIIVAVTFVLLYLLIHYNLVSTVVKERLTETLTSKLGTRVEIGAAEITWLNQVALTDVVVFDQKNDTLLHARRTMMAYEFVPLIEKDLVINTIQLIDFGLHIRRDSLGAEPNYAFIIEAFAPKQQDNRRTIIDDASVRALYLRQGTVTYDVLDQPHSDTPWQPDFCHLAFHDLSACLSVDVSHINGLDVWLKRLSVAEGEQAAVYSLTGRCRSSESGLRVDSITTELCYPLDEETLVTGTLAGHVSWTDDALLVTLLQADIDADRWGDLHAKGNAALCLDSPDSLSYCIDFGRSSVTYRGATRIAERCGTRLPSDLKPLLQAAGSLYWEGRAVGSGLDSVAYTGTLGTTGQIRTSAQSDVRWTDGSLEGSHMEGNFAVRMSGCRLAGHANVGIAQSATDVEFRSRIQQLEPNRAGLTSWQNLEGISLMGNASGRLSIPTGSMQADPDWHNWSHIPVGHAQLEDIVVQGPLDTLHLAPFRLDLQRETDSEREQDIPVAVLNSPVCNVVATPTALVGYMPPNTRLTQMLSLPGELQQEVTFTVEWDSAAHTLKAEGHIPQLTHDDATYALHFAADGTTATDSPLPENLATDVKFDYRSGAHTLTTELALEMEQTPFEVRIAPSTLTIDSMDLKIANASLTRDDDGCYRLRDFVVENQEQRLDLTGALAQDGRIEATMTLDKFQSDFFFNLLGKKYLAFGGNLSGQAVLSSDSLLHIQSDSLHFDRFSYIGTQLGTADFALFCDLDTVRLDLDARVHTDSVHSSRISGSIDLGQRRGLDLTFATDSMRIDFVEYWLSSIMQDVQGYASGDIRLCGAFDSLCLLGHPMLQRLRFSNDFLGGRFTLDDTIHMTDGPTPADGLIALNRAHVYDQSGNPAYISLDLRHRHLGDFRYEVDLDIPNTQAGFLVYNHPQQEDRETYWGKVWATGKCQMSGGGGRHHIGLQMAPAGHSVFYLSPNESNLSESSYSFLTFRDKSQLRNTSDTDGGDGLPQTDTKTDAPTYIEADLLIHANEKCQVLVQMDPLAEDRMTCRGTGDLSLHYDPYHDLTLTGVYNLSQGSYTVNLKGDLMSKAFQIQDGSSISFSGSPSESVLDLNAVYSIPSANLQDLDESFASLTSLNRTSLPVDCKLQVTGPISSPQIKFDLEVKNTSDDVQALVHNIIGTQEMLDREVFYLLLFNKFYTPEYASTSQRQSASELSSFASSSLNSQLNNILGHMSDNFTLGTNVRSSKGDFSDMEMDFSISTRFLNDRLLLNGNVGYRDSANQMEVNTGGNSFIGDFDLEYLITPSGTVRAKAYSHYNERDYSINNALTTQGIGIILRKDFNDLLDLLNRKR